MKWLNRMLSLLLALGTLAMLGVVALFWLLASQSGTDLLMSKVRPRAAPAVEIGRVTGSVLGGLVIEDVHVRLARDELDFARLEVSWDVAAALTGVVGFKNARVSPVTYRRLPAGAAGGRDAVLDLPFEIRIVNAVADGLVLERGEDALAFGETRFSARFANRVLDLGDVATESAGIALRGRGSIDLTSAVALRVEGEWSGDVGNLRAAGRLRVDGEWPVLRVQHDLTAPFTATADGELRFEPVPRADLRLEWQGFDVPGLDGYSSPRGALALSGAIDDYRFEADGALDLGGRAASFAIAGNGEAGLLHVVSLALQAQTADGAPLGELQGAGDVSLDGRTADLTVTARDFDPAWLVDGWPGRLNGTTALHAALSPLEARFESIALTGELRGYRVALRGAAARSAPARWDFTALRLESGSNLLVLDGSIDPGAIALEVDADVADLDLLLPGSSGGVTVDAALAGTLAEPSVRGLIEARAVRYAGYTLARLKVQGAAGLAPAAPLDLRIEADGLARGTVRADTARARLTGTTGAQRIEASASADDWAATLEANGALENGVWSGALNRLDVDEMVLGGWRLTEPSNVSFGAGHATVATSCLQHASRALACAGLRLEGRPEDRLVLSAQNIELGTLKPLLPPALSIDGVYQLSASVFDLMGTPRGALAVTGGVTRVRVAFGTEQAFATELDGFIAGGTLIDGRLELQASVSSGTDGSIALDASIDDVRLRDSPIGGGIHVRWPDLGFLTLLSPDLGQVGGSLAVDLDVAGTVREPEVEGTAAWNDGRVAVPEWGLVVEAIEARARSDDGRALVFDGTGKVGDGVLNIEGGTQLDPERGWPTELKLRGDSIRAVQLPEAEIFVTPDLDVRVQLPDVRVTGTVHVPRAEIELSALPAQAVTPSADAVVHGVAEREETRPLRLQADLMLTLGEAVHYSGLNLATTVSGQLRLNVDAARSAAASGTLTLNGSYNAYGQTLQLERGELLFNGPLDDPGLSVRAVREIEATTAGAAPTRVGVELVGTVTAPRTRVFSTPAMSEADALSYLLLGRPVTGSSGTQETATLQTAAISMGLSQALPVVQRIGQTLGLDELSVQTTDTDQGALMAGKFLSPRVYIRYSYGLFNRIGGLLVRFKLNQRLSLETRSGDEKSMDLLYTVEKD